MAPRVYLPGGNSNLQLHVLAQGSTPKSPLPLGGDRDPCVRYDTIDDLNWKTDRQAASLI